MRFTLRLKGIVYKSYVRPATVQKRSMVLGNSKYLMLVLGLNESIDHLAMANSVRWYGHVLSGQDVDGQRNIGWS